MYIGEAPVLIKTRRQKDLFSWDHVDEQTLRAHYAQADLLLNSEKDFLLYWQSSDFVDIARFDGKQISFCGGYKPEWGLLQDMRIFNESYELHIWRFSNGVYNCREISGEELDSNLSSSNCLDQKIRLWGSRATKCGSFTKITEERGMALSLPCQYQDSFGRGINAFLQERRYITEDDCGRILFTDRRFCWVWIAAGMNGRLHKMEVE